MDSRGRFAYPSVSCEKAGSNRGGGAEHGATELRRLEKVRRSAAGISHLGADSRSIVNLVAVSGEPVSGGDHPRA